MIFTDGCDEALEGNGAAEADAGFLVGFFLGDAAEGLKENEVGLVVAEDEGVIVGLVQAGGDREFALLLGGVGKELGEIGGIEAGEGEVAGVEGGEERGELFVVGLGELGEAIVGEEVAALLGGGVVVLDLDGDEPVAAFGHEPGAVAFDDAAGEIGEDDGAAPAIAEDDLLVAVELLGGVEFGVVGVRLERGGGAQLVEGAVDGDSRRLDGRLGGWRGGLLRDFMGSCFFAHV